MNDIEVHFKYTDPLVGNPGLLKVAPSKVHHQYATTLTTPVFPNFNLLTCKVEAEMYLWKKSEEISSEPVPFYFHPTKVYPQKPHYNFGTVLNASYLIVMSSL